MIQKNLVSLFLFLFPFSFIFFFTSFYLVFPLVPSSHRLVFPLIHLSPVLYLCLSIFLICHLIWTPILFSPLPYLSLIMLFFFFSATLHFLPSNLSSHTLFYIPFRYLRSHNFVCRLFSFPFPKLFIFQPSITPNSIFSCLLIPCISSPSLFI